MHPTDLHFGKTVFTNRRKSMFRFRPMCSVFVAVSLVLLGGGVERSEGGDGVRVTQIADDQPGGVQGGEDVSWDGNPSPDVSIRSGSVAQGEHDDFTIDWDEEKGHVVVTLSMTLVGGDADICLYHGDPNQNGPVMCSRSPLDAPDTVMTLCDEPPVYVRVEGVNPFTFYTITSTVFPGCSDASVGVSTTSGVNAGKSGGGSGGCFIGTTLE
jgi:hypothetical protein